MQKTGSCSRLTDEETEVQNGQAAFPGLMSSSLSRGLQGDTAPTLPGPTSLLLSAVLRANTVTTQIKLLERVVRWDYTRRAATGGLGGVRLHITAPHSLSTDTGVTSPLCRSVGPAQVSISMLTLGNVDRGTAAEGHIIPFPKRTRKSSMHPLRRLLG